MITAQIVDILVAHQLDVLSYPTRYSCICQRREPAPSEWPASHSGYRSWAEHVAAVVASSPQGELF